jgi:hypothetical protein
LYSFMEIYVKKTTFIQSMLNENYSTKVKSYIDNHQCI